MARTLAQDTVQSISRIRDLTARVSTFSDVGRDLDRILAVVNDMTPHLEIVPSVRDHHTAYSLPAPVGWGETLESKVFSRVS